MLPSIIQNNISEVPIIKKNSMLPSIAQIDIIELPLLMKNGS